MRTAIRTATLALALCALGALIHVPGAAASRSLLSEAALDTATISEPQYTEGEIEGPCGLAFSPTGLVYLADYYHRLIDVFQPPLTEAKWSGLLPLPGVNPEPGVNTLDSICGLAFDAEGNLYGNEWHEAVKQLTPTEATIDTGESTGLAIDPSTNRLYVDDRGYVAEYALPFSEGSEPLAKIGLGAIGEGYGLAAANGRIYVADATAESVKVFEPATSTNSPVATISGRFNSLTDAALAIDPTNGHLLVLDDLQPGYEHPESAVREFGSPAEGYAYLGALPGTPVDGEPSGIAVAASGEVMVTDGNGEMSNAFLYGPYVAAASPTASASSPDLAAGSLAARSPAESDGGGAAAHSARRSPSRAASASEVAQHGDVRVAFQGSLAPRALPRRGRVAIIATVGARITTLGVKSPPQLRRIEIAINRNGRFDPGSLPVCRLEEIQPATTSAALAACRRSLVGEGTFSARVLLPQQAPFPSSGKVYAFNGRYHGHPAILAHVYGTDPLPVSYTLPFELLPGHGAYGTVLRASLPKVTGSSGYITGISLRLGGPPGYLSAGCPAPAGFPGVSFPFARTGFAFAGGRRIGTTLVRSCKVRGS